MWPRFPGGGNTLPDSISTRPALPTFTSLSRQDSHIRPPSLSGQRSITVDFDDGCGEGLRGFLRQIVPDAALDDPVRIFTREFLGIGTGVWMRRTIGITFKGNGGHGYDRTSGKPLLQIVIFRLAFSQCESPAIIMDHDADVIRIVEGRCTAIEGCVIEIPFRRGGLPDELRKVVPVFVVACPATFRG